MLVLDELHELGGSDTSLFGKGEAFGQELNEPELERVPDQPGGISLCSDP